MISGGGFFNDMCFYQVTFKDPDAAMRACQNPSPVIDGRRANCNLASLGAHKTRPPTPQHGAYLFFSSFSPKFSFTMSCINLTVPCFQVDDPLMNVQLVLALDTMNQWALLDNVLSTLDVLCFFWNNEYHLKFSSLILPHSDINAEYLSDSKLKLESKP